MKTSVYGTAAKTGNLAVNIGTSGQIIYVTDEFVPGEYEIRPFYEDNYCGKTGGVPSGIITSKADLIKKCREDGRLFVRQKRKKG